MEDKSAKFFVFRVGHSDQFSKGCPKLSTLGGGYIGFFQNSHLRKWGNLLCFVSFDRSTWDILMVLRLIWWFGGEGVWMWCSADNHISGWGIFLKSGIKSTKKFNFQSYFLLSSHILATNGLWKWFLKIIIHIISRSTTYYLLPWPPHWICKMANQNPRWPIMICVIKNAIPHGYICYIFSC